MPPRFEEQQAKQEARSARQKITKAKPGADPNNPHIFNDGSLIVDGVRVRRGAWAECAVCGRRIYFIKVGGNCAFCPIILELPIETAGIPAVKNALY